MNEHFDQLVQYIQQHLNQGVPEDNVRHVLHQYRWDPEMVNQAFMYIHSHSPTPTLQSVHTPQQQPQPVGHQASHEQALSKNYRLFRAISDAVHAIRHNIVTFALALLISYVMAVISLLVITLLFGVLFVGHFSGLTASPSKWITMLVGGLLLYTIWYAFAYALVLSAASLPLYAGDTHRKNSLDDVLSTTFARIIRVAKAMALMAIVMIWPVVLFIFLSLIPLLGGHIGGGIATLILVPIAILVSLVWTILALLRFALVPYVALYEPHVSIRGTLGRSKELLRSGGQWFLIKGFLLTLVVVILLSALTHQDVQKLNSTNSVVVNLILILVSIITNSTLVMLYRNRRTIESRETSSPIS